jgi:lipopolysaccharide transport system permease protein
MLGPLWSVGQPLFLVCLLAVAFHFLVGGRMLPSATGGDYTVYILSGLVPWITFTIVLGRAPSDIVGSANLVKQVVFPVELLPLQWLLRAGITWLVGILFVLAYTLVRTGGLPWTVGLVPLLGCLQLFWMAGAAYLLSALGVYFRDLKDLVSLGVTANLYLLPIVYLPGKVPGVLSWVVQLNPFSPLVWVYQDCLYHGSWQHPWAWVLYPVYSLASFSLGLSFFRKLRPAFGDML